MPGKIRVLHVLPRIYRGGVERRRALIAESKNPDFEYHFFVLEARGDTYDRIIRAGGTVHALGVPKLLGMTPFWRLFQLVRSLKPHIVHGAVFEGVMMTSVVGTAAGFPILIGEETSEARNRSWKGHLLFRALMSRMDKAIAISPQVREAMTGLSGIPPEKIQLITNGVLPYEYVTTDAREKAKLKFGIRSDQFVVGTLSRLDDDSEKRVSDVIRAVANLNAAGVDAVVLVCGDGLAKIGLEELSEQLGVRANVVFAGNVAEPFSGLAAMDVFAHPSVREGFGLAVAEAAFCGLPVVTTGVGGIAEIVVPEETGIFVPVGEPEAIAAAVTRLYEQPELREAMGMAGRARAMERFSAQRYVRDVEALYYQLLREKKVKL